MRLIVIGLLLVGTFSQIALAQVGRFSPYTAIVDSDMVEVRSGPGQKYYATSELSRGERVIIHRHDPGGWYMIKPPAGSFSWIRADAIKRLSSDRGVLSDNNVIVRVGSTLSEIRDVFQKDLSTGAAIEILGEKTFRTEQGPVRMYKITSPQGEWRWLPGRVVTPIDRVVRKQLDHSPSSVLAQSHPPVEKDLIGATRGRQSKATGLTSKQRTPKGPRLLKRPLIQTVNDGVVRRSGPTADELRKDRHRLNQLDVQFSAILDKDTVEWNFAALKEGYLKLQQSVSHSAFASQVDLRLAAVERYETTKSEYDDFIKLTSETRRRDVQLLTLQQTQLKSANQSPATRPANDSPAAIPMPVSPSGSAPAATDEPVQRRPTGPTFTMPEIRLPTPPASQSPPSTSISPRPAPSVPQPSLAQTAPTIPRSRIPLRRTAPAVPGTVPRPGNQQPAAQPMIAAGIIQRTAAPQSGTPGYVLLAPNGRILAYLTADAGVNLDRYLGQEMGVFGRRTQRGNLQLNVILVRGLTPVRLQR